VKEGARGNSHPYLDRRHVITLLGGAAAVWPLAAHGQQTKVYRIGALVVGNADVHPLRTELREGLRKSGYVEGQNLLFEFRSAEEELDRLPSLAAELVALKVDVIVAIYTPCALAAQRATREIPIVIVSGNPIETGLVPSLSRPPPSECQSECGPPSTRLSGVRPGMLR
jgi:putative tryptophan/tyrosine transport system substrate-binding protein